MVWYVPFLCALSIGLTYLAIRGPEKVTAASIQGTYVTGGEFPLERDGFSLDVLEDGAARVSCPGYLPEAEYRYINGRIEVEACSEIGGRVTWVFEVEPRRLVSGGFRLERLQ
jgi:hypothetical protein